MRVDLNCDMGESFGRWELGADAGVMPHITSANIACGAHAGDPATMRRTLRLAREHRVSAGAHPGFDDLRHGPTHSPRPGVRDDIRHGAPPPDVAHGRCVATPLDAGAQLLDGQDDELVRVRIRQRPQQRGVDDAEERRGDTRAERERQHGDRRERGLPSQLAQSILHVLRNGLEEAAAADVIATVLDHRKVAEPQVCGATRRCRVEPVPGELVRSHLQVELQFLLDFIDRSVAPEQRAQFGDDEPDEEHQLSCASR